VELDPVEVADEEERRVAEIVLFVASASRR
jgi:hypothetical protein